jgi:hypothetical protein
MLLGQIIRARAILVHLGVVPPSTLRKAVFVMLLTIGTAISAIVLVAHQIW